LGGKRFEMSETEVHNIRVELEKLVQAVNGISHHLKKLVDLKEKKAKDAEK
jgi:hypothetical protein